MLDGNWNAVGEQNNGLTASGLLAAVSDQKFNGLAKNGLNNGDVRAVADNCCCNDAAAAVVDVELTPAKFNG